YFKKANFFTARKKKKQQPWDVELLDHCLRRLSTRFQVQLKKWRQNKHLGTTMRVKPAHNNTSRTEITWVKDLLDSSDRHWNIGVVERCFSKHESEEILKLRRSDPIAEDKLIWDDRNKGQFSVLYVYNKLVG
ncbi:glutamate dehydrogenase 2, partial [Striga asiatica]